MGGTAGDAAQWLELFVAGASGSLCGKGNFALGAIGGIGRERLLSAWSQLKDEPSPTACFMLMHASAALASRASGYRDIQVWNASVYSPASRERNTASRSLNCD